VNADSPAPARKRIFIVEDERIASADLEHQLRRMEYVVVGTAFSGEEAIEKLESLRPDLVLMDISLPGLLDGVQVGAFIFQAYQIPVVYLTAHSDDATMKRARISQPFGYILKPFEHRELNMAIEIALYRHSVEMELRELNRQLQAAHEQVITLRGLLPICSWCRKVRDDHGYWQALEEFVEKHCDAKMTHGICPECAKANFREFIKP
jgi:two-component system, response regulator PdtaR